MLASLIYFVFDANQKRICDAIKQNESEVENMIFGFWHFLLGYFLGFKGTSIFSLDYSGLPRLLQL